MASYLEPLRRRRPLVLQPAHIIGAVALPLLLLLVLAPALVLARQSLGQPASLAYWQALLLGQPGAALPFWSLQHSAAFLWRPLGHSLVVAGASTALATVIGAGLGALSGLTNLRYTRALRLAAVFHLVFPPFALALAWLRLSGAWRLADMWTSGPLPMIGVLTLHFYAFAYLLVEAAARNLDAGLLEAAQVHSGGTARLTRRIILPLLQPAVLTSAGVIGFSSLAAFAPMQLLGGGRQPYYVLTTQIYSLYYTSLGDPRAHVLAGVVALTLMAVAALPLALLLGASRGGRRYATLAGRGHRVWRLDLGRWRAPLSLTGAAFSLIGVGLPVGALIAQALVSAPGGGVSLAPLRALAASAYLLSIGNSLLLAGLTATVGALVTLPLAYSIQRGAPALVSHTLAALAALPFALPGVALGLAYFTLITQPLPLFGLTVSLHGLYGSLPLAVLVSLVKHLPLGAQTQASGLLQIDAGLEEAATVCRASFRRVATRILLPLLRPSLYRAWLLLFIFVFKEVDILAFVYAPLAGAGAGGPGDWLRAPPIMVYVLGLLNSEGPPEIYAQGAALLLLVCLILLGATLAAARLGWRPLDSLPGERV